MKRIAMLGGLMVLGAVGCGGGSSGNGVGKYVGIWTYSSGTETTTCPDFSPSTDTEQLTGSVNIVAGSSADLVTTDNTSCVLKFDLDKNGVAQVLPGQTCSSPIAFADGTTGTLNLTPQTWMLSLFSPTVLASSGSGTATILDAGSTFPCTFSITSMLSKQ